jgi:hypothetical protein
MITVAQFLSTKDTSNYQVDESEYLAEFLEQNCCAATHEEDRELEDLPMMSTSNDILLSNDELVVLCHIAGYCLHSLNR